ncbi:MAG: helix-hairpin-helix domain-containing protein [Prochloraceae cyanobacterium]
MKQLKRLGERQLITLGQELKREGKGKIYQVLETPSLVAKVYHSNKRIGIGSEKLELMLADPPENNSYPDVDIAIAWPVDLLAPKNNNQQIVGYLMPKIKNAISIERYYQKNSLNHKKFKDPSCENFDFKSHKPYRAAINLAAAFRAIHAKGYVIGDVNESNILVKENGSIVIINTDSFQVCNLAKNAIYYCSTSNPEFTPPELQGKNLTKVHRTPQQDLFGLGILIFKLLMAGVHPYDSIFVSTDEARERTRPIRLGHFPYGKRKIFLSPPAQTPPFKHLHPQLQELFISCFEKGHSHPSARPNAIVWQQALQKAEAELLTCKKNPQHKYDNHLNDCPWCDSDRALDFNQIVPNELPPAVRTSDNFVKVKKNSSNYSDRKPITKPKAKAQFSSSSPLSFGEINYYKKSSKSWLTPRKKIALWGLSLLSILGLWVFIAIAITYPIQSLIGTISIGLLSWIIFISKSAKK